MILDFIKFWVNCLLSGVSLFEGIVLWSGLLCVAVWVYYWFSNRRHTSEEATKKRNEAIEKYSKKIGIVLLVLHTFLLAPYSQFKSERKAKNELQRTIDDISPKLTGFIDQTLIGQETGTTNSLVLLQVSISNAGRSPSIAENFQLSFVKNKKTVKATPVHFNDEYKITAFAVNSNLSLALKRPELISEKTTKAIQPGESPRGWIAFRLPSTILNGYNPKSTNGLLVLSFIDINEKRSFVTNGYWKGALVEEIETLQSPRTLPGSVNLLVQDANVNGASKTSWLPPELTSEYTNVIVWFGGQATTYPINVAKIPPTLNGAKFRVQDLPDFLLDNIENNPGYSPRQKDMWFRLESLRQDYGGKTVNLPYAPFVENNRLFVSVQIPFKKEKQKLIMSEEFDSELGKLPRLWDRNYGTNCYAYEIVNEHKKPVLQVFYTSPNEIHINGIFIVDTNAVLDSFANNPILYTFDYKFINKTNNHSEITNILDYLTAEELDEEIKNTLYMLRNPSEKPIFKYPSNRHLSVLSE